MSTIDMEILQSIVLMIENEIRHLEKIIAESVSNVYAIKESLKKIHQYFQELDKFGLSEYSLLINFKNDSAEKLRSLSIAIYDQTNSTELALLFLAQSAELAHSDTIRKAIESDIKQIKENALWDAIAPRFDKVEAFIAEQKIEEAAREYLNLDNELAKQKGEPPNEVRVIMLNNYCLMLNGYCLQLMNKGHEPFEKKGDTNVLLIDGLLYRKNRKKAIHLSEHALKMLAERVDLLNFTDPSSDRAEFLKMIARISNSLKSKVESLDDQSLLEAIEALADKQINENTQTTIKLLDTAHCFSTLYRGVFRMKRKMLWKGIGFAAVIVFCFIVNMNMDRSEPPMTDKEKTLIKYLETSQPEILKKARQKGYSDKKIAQSVIEYSKDE